MPESEGRIMVRIGGIRPAVETMDGLASGCTQGFDGVLMFEARADDGQFRTVCPAPIVFGCRVLLSHRDF